MQKNDIDFQWLLTILQSYMRDGTCCEVLKPHKYIRIFDNYYWVLKSCKAYIVHADLMTAIDAFHRHAARMKLNASKIYKIGGDEYARSDSIPICCWNSMACCVRCIICVQRTYMSLWFSWGARRSFRLHPQIFGAFGTGCCACSPIETWLSKCKEEEKKVNFHNRGTTTAERWRRRRRKEEMLMKTKYEEKRWSFAAFWHSMYLLINI